MQAEWSAMIRECDIVAVRLLLLLTDEICVRFNIKYRIIIIGHWSYQQQKKRLLLLSIVYYGCGGHALSESFPVQHIEVGNKLSIERVANTNSYYSDWITLTTIELDFNYSHFSISPLDWLPAWPAGCTTSSLTNDTPSLVLCLLQSSEMRLGNREWRQKKGFLLAS